MSKAMTVRALREALEGKNDDLEVILRADTGDDVFVCGLLQVSVEQGCTETDALMLDGGNEEDEGIDDGEEVVDG